MQRERPVVDAPRLQRRRLGCCQLALQPRALLPRPGSVRPTTAARCAVSCAARTARTTIAAIAAADRRQLCQQLRVVHVGLAQGDAVRVRTATHRDYHRRLEAELRSSSWHGRRRRVRRSSLQRGLELLCLAHRLHRRLLVGCLQLQSQLLLGADLLPQGRVPIASMIRQRRSSSARLLGGNRFAKHCSQLGSEVRVVHVSFCKIHIGMACTEACTQSRRDRGVSVCALAKHCVGGEAPPTRREREVKLEYIHNITLNQILLTRLNTMDVRGVFPENTIAREQ